MEISQFLLNITGDATLGKWLVIAMAALAAFALVLAGYFLFSGFFDPVKRRLHNVTNTVKPQSTYVKDSVSTLGSHFVVKDEGELSYDRKRLLYAGYHDKESLARYYGIKIVLTLGLPALAFLVCTLIPGVTSKVLLMAVGAAMMAGFIGPSFILDKQVESRQRTIRNSFPDSIDQLIVCTEAGLGLDSGLQRVARDTALSNEIMGYELSLVNAELRGGVPRERALKNLVARTGVEEIRGLVSAISQSMRFGTSIGDTLRVFAEDLRDKRMQSAEEEAAKLAVKMLFPLAFCFFPGIFIVILGPAVISIYAAFS
jgi:tight adherence protein C